MSRGKTTDRGQYTVELALSLPLLCVLMLGVVQVVVIVAEQLQVESAARSGARAATVSADPAGAAAHTAHLVIASSHVSTQLGGGIVTVTVSVDAATDVPLIGALLPDISLRATSSMLVDPP